jgi:hypothetical protein
VDDRPPDARPSTALPPDDPIGLELKAALQPGYLLVRQLGQGGMGSVYLARDPALKRSVAVKVLLPELAKDATSRARFQREAQAVAAVSHPSVIGIYSVGELPGGVPYFVMQYVEGRSFEARLEADGPLGVREARRVLGEVAAALAAAHKRGIVHRDIKPANILQDEETGRAVVSDFGIAAVQSAEAAASPRLTQTGMSPGTPTHMAPEQLLGEAVDAKTDIYSFGILAYELLTGAGPFKITNPQEAVAAHLRDTPALLSTLRPEIEPDLEHLVASCLAKTPGERPTAEQIAQRLLPGEHVLLEWPPPGMDRIAGALPKFGRRLALAGLLFALSVLALLGRDLETDRGLPLWGLGAGVLLGFGALMAASSAAFKALRRTRRLARQGYRWGTILEAMVDARGDTGALIGGGREYALLPPATRGRLRALRMVRGAAWFLAGTLPLPLLLLAVRLGASGIVGPGPGLLVVLVPILLVASVTLLLGRNEDRSVSRQRAPRSSGKTKEPVTLRPVVEAWTTSLDSASGEQFAGGRAPPAGLMRALASTLLYATIIGSVVVIPVVLMVPMGAVLSAVSRPHFSSTFRRIRTAEVGRRYPVVIDASIGPDSAGRALHSLLLAGVRLAEPGLRAAGTPLPPGWDSSLGSNPFGRGFVGQQDSLLRRAARGALTPAERRYLSARAEHPVTALLRAVAHARAVEIIGTRWRQGELDSAAYWTLPIPKLGWVRDLAMEHTGVAALRLAEGRRPDAETALREEIAFGIALMDHGTFMVETLVGAAIASNGRERLETFYTLTGREADAAVLRAARESAIARAEREEAALERLTAGLNSAAESHAIQRAMLTDTTLPRSVRWDFVQNAVVEPCLQARSLMFGPSPAWQSALAGFRKDAVRSAADSAYYRVITRGLARSPADAGSSIVGAIAGAIGTALGTPNLAACARTLGMNN